MIYQRYFTLLLVLFALGGGGASRQCYASPEQQFDQVLPLLKKYCYECHAGEESQGGLDLAKYNTFAKSDEDRKIWDQVLVRHLSREMPPEGSPAPHPTERVVLTNWFTAMVSVQGPCNQIANDDNTSFYHGHVMSRRLTRTEYANSIRDLLGVSINVADKLPSDGSGGVGFDTVGDSLFLSPIHLERYVETSKLIVDALWPSDPALPSQSGNQKLIDSINPHEGETHREAAIRVLTPIVRLAFRRPIEEGEMDRYLALYDRAISHGDGHVAGVKLALQGIIVSPHFLFLAEPEPENEGVYALKDHPLGARLAMLIWSSLPDDELLTAADEGRLQTDEELLYHVRRMLQDPRADAIGENFAIQWLGIGSLGVTVRPDPNQFPEFTDELSQAMKQETATYIANLFRENRSLLELIDSDYTYVNESLAQLYGIPDVEGPEMQRVQLQDRNRGGVLTHASTLTVSSYPLRTSPVLRGRWVLEELLGSRVPPPPPGVPPLDEEGEDGEHLTIREQLERHRADPICASCHARMDPIGFGMENFDPIGRWREDLAGFAIDASGKMPSGEVFNGPAEMKSVLMNRKNEVMAHLARKMYGYAVGRGLNKFDDCVIKEAVEKLEKNDYQAQLLVEHIVLSYQFRHRFCKK